MNKFTTQQAARKLGTQPYNLYQWKAKGWIPTATRIGRTDYYTTEQIREIRSHLVAGVFRQQPKSEFNSNETARKLGVDCRNIHHWRKQGHISTGTRSGKRWYYTAKQIDQIRKDIETGQLWQRGKDGLRYFNISEATRFCGVNKDCLLRLVSMGRVPAPTHGKLRPKYREDELPGLKAAVEKWKKDFVWRSWQTGISERGYYSITKAAGYLDMPYITFVSYLKKGKLPRPTHRIGCQDWYTKADLDTFRNRELREYFLERKRRAGD